MLLSLDYIITKICPLGTGMRQGSILIGCIVHLHIALASILVNKLYIVQPHSVHC